MAGLIIDEPEEQAEHQRHEEEVGQVEALHAGADTPVDELGVHLLEAADGLGVGDHQGNAVDDGLGAQGGDKGRNMQLGDDEAVDQAPYQANGDHDQEHQANVHFRHELPQPAVVVAALAQDARDHGGKAHLAAGGQIGALGNQAAADTQGNQETHGSVAHQVAQVAPGEEIVLQAAHDDGGDEQQENNGIAGDKFPNFLAEAGIFRFHIFLLLMLQTAWRRS